MLILNLQLLDLGFCKISNKLRLVFIKKVNKIFDMRKVAGLAIFHSKKRVKNIECKKKINFLYCHLKKYKKIGLFYY